MIRANDNKDRCIATLQADAPDLKVQHRLSDPASINWAFNEFGWLGQGHTLWFLSEQSGFAHFYTVDAQSGGPRARTAGRFEVKNPDLPAGTARISAPFKLARPVSAYPEAV